MRLNGWQRIGIVASVVWFFAGGLIGNDLVMGPANDSMESGYRFCWMPYDRIIESQTRAQLKAFGENEIREAKEAREAREAIELNKADDAKKNCEERARERFVETIKDHWWFALAFATIPIPIAWLIIRGLVALYRWIRAGFKREQISN